MLLLQYIQKVFQTEDHKRDMQLKAVQIRQKVEAAMTLRVMVPMLAVMTTMKIILQFVWQMAGLHL